jgi:hypothetical protein
MNENNEHLNFDGKIFKLLYQTSNQPLIFINDKVIWSPIGPGVLNDATPVGFPKVNDIAVTTLVTERGIVYGDLRNLIFKAASERNREIRFSYLFGDTYFLEGTGPYAEANFGHSATLHDVRDFFLEWKVSYIEAEKTEQQIKDEKRFQYGVEIATPGIESILKNKDLSDEQKKEQLIRHCANWIQSYAQESDNSNFYRSIVTQIGEMFGETAKTSEDGSIQEDILTLKVPELVKELKEKHDTFKSKLLSYIGAIS